jgi:putative ABC transport system ATP-binding protein
MTSRSPYLIEVKGLSKSYQLDHGIVYALKAVDLKISSGEHIALMGPSGSGKSTLMHLLGCLDRPSSGRYLLDGDDVSELDDAALSYIRATQIGFVFQSFNLIPQLNVYENVELPFLYRNEKFDPQEKILHAIARVGLSHRVHHRPNELSGGEIQRVAIARALAIDPMLILADEPTGNLDFKTGQSILTLFQELNRQGVTLLIVTHDAIVGKSCQKVLSMQDGELVQVACQGEKN